MNAEDPDPTSSGHQPIALGMPSGLPANTLLRRVFLPTGDEFELLTVPVAESEGDGITPRGDSQAGFTTTLRDWVGSSTMQPVVVPLYGCLVVQGPGRAAVAGHLEQHAQLELAVIDFAGVESELRDAERRSSVLIDAVEADAAGAAATESHSPDHRAALATRYHEAVAVARRLAMLAPAIHAPPVHPPTLASQLGERLRDRTRLVERHQLATERVELAERVADSCSQRALETAVARKQTGLEWTIVVLLVVQTALLVVDLLARRGTP